MREVKEFTLPNYTPAIFLQQSGEGELVVFLHGIGGNSNNWCSQLQAIGGSYTAVAWDMRGYGNSEDYDGPFRIDDACNDLLAVINHYKAECAHIVGLSMGGMLAQEFYRRHPEKVASLVLTNTNEGIGVAFSQQEKDEFVRLRKQPLAGDNEPATLVASMLQILLGKNPIPSARKNIEESIRSLRKSSYIKSIEAIIDFDSSDVLPTISVPVLLIGSTEDRVTPVESMIAMNKKISGSQLYIFDDVGHLTNLEAPNNFNELLLDFLSQV